MEDDFRLVTSSSFTFIREMASLRKLDILTLKNQKERLPPSLLRKNNVKIVNAVLL